MTMCTSMAVSADCRCGSVQAMCGMSRRRLPQNWSPERRALLLLLQQLQPTAQRFADVCARELLRFAAVASRDGVDDGLVLAAAGRRATGYGERSRTEQSDPVLQFPRSVVEIAVARGAADRLVEGAVEPCHFSYHVGRVGPGRFDKGLLDVPERIDLGRRRVLGGKSGGGALHDLAHRIEFEYLGDVEVAYDQAAAAGR